MTDTCKKSEGSLKYNYYRSIDFLPLFNFFKTIESEDLRYLLKIDDYELMPEVDLKELGEAWININNEYEQTEDSNSTIIQFTTAKSIHNMELEYLMLWNIYNLMSIAPDHEETKEVLNYANLNMTVKQIEKKLKALKNRISLKRIDIKKDESIVKPDYFQIIDKIEDVKGRAIDLNKTTVRQYIAIKKNLKNGKRQNKAG